MILKYSIFLVFFLSTSTNAQTPSSCSPGSYSSTGGAPCSVCPVNTYSWSAESNKCEACSLAGTSTAGSSSCECNEFGKFGSDISGAGSSGTGRVIDLSFDGSVVAISSPQHNSNRGTVKVYQYNKGTSTWVQRGLDADLQGFTTTTWAGHGVAISGDGTVVLSGAAGIGVVRAYAWNATTAAWLRMGLDSQMTGVATYSYGSSVDLSSDGSVALVGAPGYPSVSPWQGTALAYRWNSTSSSWGVMGSGTEFQGSVSVVTEQNCGRDVKLSSDGTIAMVGCGGGGTGGSLKLYKWNSTVNSWQALGEAITRPYHGFGFSVSMSGDGKILLAGVYGYSSIGTALAFRWTTGSGWVAMGNETQMSPGTPGSTAGISVSLSADGYTALVGDDSWQNGGFIVGTARFYVWSEAKFAWIR